MRKEIEYGLIVTCEKDLSVEYDTEVTVSEFSTSGKDLSAQHEYRLNRIVFLLLS